MPPKSPLLSLSVQALRGATAPFSISFEKSKSLTLIYGENGTGKTTLCDAFDFIGNGQVGSLDGRGLGSTAPYWASIGKSKNDVMVALETSSGKWVASMAGRGAAVKVLPDDGAMPRVSVLRRSQLLQLLQNTPANRYDAIRPFIDISPIEACENELRKLILEKERQLTTASAVVTENKVAIEGEWTVAGKPAGSALAWAKAEAGRDTADLDGGITKLRGLSKLLDAMETGVERIEQAEEQVDSAQRRLDIEDQALGKAKESCLADDVSTIQLLLAAQEHLAGHDHVEHCPLCGSSEYAADLPAQVKHKLKILSELRRALADRETAAARLKQAQTILENEQAALVESAGKFEAVWQASQAVLADRSGLRDSVAALVAVLKNGQGLAAGLKAADLGATCDQALAEVQALEGAKARLTSLRMAVERYEGNYASLREINRVLPSLRKTLKATEEERKAFVDRLLHAIAQEVGRLYEKLHPGEGLNKISLALDPARRSSLDLAAEFLTAKDVPPHAYFSESHLDSLGLCIFLSLASLKGRDRTILVLDDVLGSIDEPHVDRLIHLLYEESEHFLHCVITTHYRPWKEKFRWGLLRHGQCQFVELKPWSAAKGVSCGKTSLTPVAELGKLLAEEPPSAQLLCGSAGVVLEAVCDYLTAHYECAVPRRKGKPTLGDLLPPIDKKLKPVLKIERRQADGSYAMVDLGPIFDKLQDMAQIRNIFGCHFNDLSMHLPEQDAIEFARLVHAAADALCCTDEGWPMVEKAGSYWATRTETRRLHPYKKPS